jgi:hypothetical protein
MLGEGPMENQTRVIKDRAEVLAESLFSLQDPWRDRFLVFLAQRALGQAWDGQMPTEREVSGWLGRDGLRKTVLLMLNRWPASARIH